MLLFTKMSNFLIDWTESSNSSYKILLKSDNGYVWTDNRMEVFAIWHTH
jgi:hypothetical protein